MELTPWVLENNETQDTGKTIKDIIEAVSRYLTKQFGTIWGREVTQTV